MKSLLLSLAIPPIGFVTLIICGLVLSFWLFRTGRAVVWAAAIGLLLFSMPVLSYSALVALESGLPTRPLPGHPPQAIIVLGAEVIRSRDEPLGVRPGLLTLDRLRTAAALHRRTGLPILATGGTSQIDVAAVGLAMERSLRDDFQAPARWVEAKSLDTWENARFSADILRAEGITSVYVVTSSWHMKRALLAFKGTGLIVTAAPTPVDIPLGPQIEGFMPHASILQLGYYAVHEWIGLAWYSYR